MSSLRRYVLCTSILAAVATGCSTTDQNPPGQAGAAGSSVGSGGSTGSGGGFTAGTGGSGVAGMGGSASGGSELVPALAEAALLAWAVTPRAAAQVVPALAATSPRGEVPGTGGTTSTGGSGGGEPAPGCGNTAAPKGARNLTIQVNGKARTYVLFVPNGYDATKSIPLIFAWHSSGASGAESRRYYKLEPVTGDGAIIVYPDGLNGAWDVSANGVDMKFFDVLLESISKDYCVDQARVFSTGYSFGGMMSHSLACDRGSKLRAFAPMAGAFFDGTKSCADASSCMDRACKQ